jgi:DNA-binding NarL/FixJ family response regulator
MCIDLVLADPHPMMLQGLAHVLGDSGFSVKSCSATGDAALQAVLEHKPQILILDLSLADCSGLALLQVLRTQQLASRVVVFTGAPVDEVMQALALDVPGLVAKGQPHDVLLNCIHTVHRGGKWLDSDLTAQAMTRMRAQHKQSQPAVSVLTPREFTVARMVTEGWPNKKIASKLFISEGTAKLHLHHVYQKLNCPGRMSLHRLMQEQGLA